MKPIDKIVEIILEFHPDIDAEHRKDLVDSGILDSLDLVDLVVELETEFDISIPVEEIVPEHFNSAAAILNMVEHLEEEG